MERILSLIAARHGHDFGGYRRSSLERRIRSRAEVLGIPTFGAYIEYLRARPDESRALLDALFVHVTSFFRDPDAWLALNRATLGLLKQRAAAGAAVRIWNPGCATGEETYTLLMLLDKAMGTDLLRRRVRVLATDVDETALGVARHGGYTAEQLRSVPTALRASYFHWSATAYVFRDDLQRLVSFHRQDLLHSAPVPDLDLVVCRNTLMYFDAPVRRRVLERICRVLKAGGHILVGQSELLLAHGDLFQPVDLAARIFERTSVSSDGIDGSHRPEAGALPVSGSPCPAY